MPLVQGKQHFDVTTSGNYIYWTQPDPTQRVFYGNKKPFSQAHQFRSKKSSFMPSLEAAYGAMENLEIMAKFTYFTIKGRKQTFNPINLPNFYYTDLSKTEWIQPTFKTQDINVWGTYLGTRYYFQAHEYFRPFFGVSIGGLWAKNKNSFSLNIDAGFEVPVSQNVSFMFKAERLTGQLRGKIRNETTASSTNVRYDQYVSKNHSKVANFPLSLGVKVKV